MSDKIIPNPKRILYDSLVNQSRQKYMPEYVRLGWELDPMQLRQEEENRRLDFQISLQDKISKERKMNKLNVSKQAKVNGELDLDQIEFDGEEKATVPDLFWFDPETSNEELDMKEKEIMSGNILDDEIKSPSEEISDDKLTIQPTLLDVKAGQFCLTVRGEIIAVFDSIEEAEEEVDFIIFSNESSFSDVNLEDIAVFKKLKLRAGIVLGE
jgi:hypothetical protein